MRPDEIIARLEAAGQTLLSLPSDRAVGHVTPRTWDHLMPGVRAFTNSVAEPIRVTPSARAITEMDEAFLWLALIPQDRFVLRRIVAARSLVNPLTGRHVFPWRRLGALLGADHKATQRWHRQGIDLIAAGLVPMRRAA